MKQLTTQLNAALFANPKGYSVADLAELLSAPEAEVRAAITELSGFYAGSGVELVEHGDQIQLASIAPAQPSSHKPDVLSSSALEVLAIVAYRQPISRAEIEEIRGVGSEQSLRNLAERELIDVQKRRQSGVTIHYYVTTMEFLRHLGVTHISKLPKADKVTSKVTSQVTPKGITPNGISKT